MEKLPEWINALEKLVKEVEENVRSKERQRYKEGPQHEGHPRDVHRQAKRRPHYSGNYGFTRKAKKRC